MSAASVVSNLLALGVQVKDAWTKSGKDWSAFLASSEFTAIEGNVETLLASLKPADLESTLVRVRAKEQALLAGRSIVNLSVDELAAFHALSDVEHQLVNKLLKTPNKRDFLAVLVKDVLPTLASVAKVVVPLLL